MSCSNIADDRLGDNLNIQTEALQHDSEGDLRTANGAAERTGHLATVAVIMLSALSHFRSRASV